MSGKTKSKQTTPNTSGQTNKSTDTNNVDRGTVEQPVDHSAQTIFDERFRLFTDTFGKICEKEEVKTALAIVLDPKVDKPIIFMRGGEYEAAKILRDLLRALQKKIGDNITT